MTVSPQLHILSSKPASGTWTTAWTPSQGAKADDNGWNAFTLVQVLPVANFTHTGGTKIRLTLSGSQSGENTKMSAMWVGNGGATSPDGVGTDGGWTGDQVQVQVSGSNTITVTAGTTLVTDANVFVKDASHPLVIAWQFQDATADDMYRTFTDTNSKFYYKASVTEASTQAKTGYTDASGGGTYVLTKVELFI